MKTQHVYTARAVVTVLAWLAGALMVARAHQRWTHPSTCTTDDQCQQVHTHQRARQ